MLKDAIEHHRNGRFAEAERGYRAQLGERPDDADALHLLGMLRYQLGDSTEGLALLSRAHERAPDDANIELTMASVRFRDGDFEAARRGFHSALALNPNLAGAHAGIGQLALMANERERAEEHFRIALRASEEPQALAGLGALLLDRGDHDAALRHLGRAAELAPNDAMIQMTLGRAFVQRDTPAFAERAFQNALRLRPDLHRARHLLGALLIRLKRSAEAAEQYRALIGVPGFEVMAYLGLGDAARAESNFAQAAPAYREALAREPGNAIASRALAWSLAQLGQHDEAIAVYNAALALAPADETLLGARADLLTLIGQLPQAAVAWKELLERNPANLFAHKRLATVAEYIGVLGLAQAHAEIALMGGGPDAEMLLIRIRALLRAGDEAAAREALAALATLELSADQQRLRLIYLGRVHDRAREAGDAARCFAEAQRGAPMALPALVDPQPDLAAALAEAAGMPWPEAPILLLGTPGSGVEHVAALLAAQPGLVVLRDRLGAPARNDDFSQPRFAHYCGELDESARAQLRERYRAPLRASGIAPGSTVIDWLPCWDAHLLALVRRAMPGTRLLIVDNDPRDALLNWLAFGWAPGFACVDIDAAAEWLQRARRHLQFGAELDDPQRLVIAGDALIDDPEGAGQAIAGFLGVNPFRHDAQFAGLMHGLGGLPIRFQPGHWKIYREALAGAFARLDP
jgi:tetratricopeptide (TPR) repeat protein